MHVFANNYCYYYFLYSTAFYFCKHKAVDSQKRFYVAIQLPRAVPEVLEGSCNGLAFNQTSGVAAICTDNYCIQFYNLFDDREIAEVRLSLIYNA